MVTVTWKKNAVFPHKYLWHVEHDGGCTKVDPHKNHYFSTCSLQQNKQGNWELLDPDGYLIIRLSAQDYDAVGRKIPKWPRRK